MTKIASSFSAIATMLIVLLPAGAAEAQSIRTWVSGAGSDTNICLRDSPCATFQQAYTNTAAGGEIDVLDGGNFGLLTISKALTVSNDGAGTAGTAFTDTDFASIQVQAGPTDAVVLRGLNLNGANISSGPGIDFVSGASLLIDHCEIQGFQSNPGIEISNSSSALRVWVKDTVLSNDGVSGGGSVWIFGPASGTTMVQFERVHVLHAIGNGVRVDGSFGAPGALDVELRDVTVDGSTGGSGIVAVSAVSGGPSVRIVADNVTASHNAGYGLRAVGGTASVYLSRSVIEDNGVGIGESNGGAVYSYGDNRFANNSGGKGVTPTAVPLE